MGNGKGINRRQFVQQSAALGPSIQAAGKSAAEGGSTPGNKITVGMIGVGARAHQTMETILSIPGTEITAICDCYQGRIQRALERTGARAKVYPDYRQILADKSIDVAVISTPDHWHKDQAVEAVRAGKDVYIEKPLTYAIDEGNVIVEEVKKAKRILQVGSQGMSSTLQRKAREVIQSGRLGNVTMIRASFNRNTAGGAWVYPIPPDASPQSVNWDQFLGPAPKRPYDAARFFRWRCYWDYSGGASTDLFVHLMTTIHFLMDARGPQSVLALGGLLHRKDGREVPDTLSACLQYPPCKSSTEGLVISLNGTFNNEMAGESGFQILGTEGSLILGAEEMTFSPERANEDNRWIVDSWPSALEKAYYQDPKIMASEIPASRKPRVLSSVEKWVEEGRGGEYLHLAAFFDSVKSRQAPLQDALAGHRAAAVAHMVNLSYKGKKTIYWDPNRENVKI